jgi:hypothetical protein
MRESCLSPETLPASLDPGLCDWGRRYRCADLTGHAGRALAANRQLLTPARVTTAQRQVPGLF